MKKYNVFIFLSILFYILLSLLQSFFFITKIQNQDHIYRVEMNRLMHDLQYVEQLNDLSDYNYLKEAFFLSKDVTEEEVVLSFFEAQNHDSIAIKPWYQEKELMGYVKFIYEIPNDRLKSLLFFSQLLLAILELAILIFLIYLKRKVITPFHQLQSLPDDIMKGHFKSNVKIEKSKYFKTYLWKMSQLKDSLEVSKKRQLELIRDRKQLLLSLSHDIKTPLNIIKLYNQALGENFYTNKEDYFQAIHQIDEKVIEIEQYIEQITHSSKEELIDFEIQMSEFYLSDLMQNIVETYKEQCQLRHIDFIIDPYQNRLMKGDINRSQEVIENILENAIKYGDGKQIKISFSEEEYCQLIHIDNTGKTVTDQEMNHLFDSFFRGVNAEGKQGSGLGLYICLTLMRKMGGTVYAVKKSDGMSFVIVFP